MHAPWAFIGTNPTDDLITSGLPIRQGTDDSYDPFRIGECMKSQRNSDGQVLILVSDTGIGLPPERADKVFDAFFTTKPQGTGMGLSISRSIIEYARRPLMGHRTL